jgi:restriction system protein
MIPDFQTIMRPLLEIVKDGQDHSMGEIIEQLAKFFSLSDKDQNELLPSGRQPTFNNRVHWAKLYLSHAKLLTSTGRGKIKISSRGLEAIKTKDKINIHFLSRYPEFIDFRKRSRPSEKDETEREITETNHTPEEALEVNYQSIRKALAEELLAKVKTCSSQFFVKLVVELLVAMGYGGSLQDAGQAIGKSGDGGIDGIIKEDRLGLDVVCIQAKRWEGVVGRPIVQAFAGSLDGQRARKGVLISTSHFSTEALDYVTRIDKKIILIDGEQLSQLMIDNGIGVAEVQKYLVMKLDLDYFEET